MYIGLRYPEDRKKRKRRKHSRAKPTDGGATSDSTRKQCEHDARCHVPSLYIYLFIVLRRQFLRLTYSVTFSYSIL